MSSQKLAIKTIKNSLLNIASFVIGLLINFYLLRYVVEQIGIESYGISALLFVIIAPLNLTNLGFGEATTKFVAENVHQGNFVKAGAFIRTTFFMNLTIGVFGCLLVFFVGGPLVMRAFQAQINPELTQVVTNCMRVIAFGWLFNQCSATFMGVPVAMQQFKKVALGNLLSVIATALFTFLLLSQQWGLLGFTIATVLGQLVALLYWYFTAQLSMPTISLAPKIDKEAWKASFSYGGWQTIAQIGGILAQQAEKYVMGVMLNTASVGIYNVVLNIQQKIYMLVHKLSEVLFPMFSSISNDTEERKANILIKSTWITTSIAVTLLVSVIPFAHTLILLWMKNETIALQGEFVLQTICVAGAFGSATTAGYFFLLGIGKTQKITYIAILTGVVTVIASLIVLPIYGLKGAGWSALIASMAQSMAITRVMFTALKNVVPFTAILTAIFGPIFTGTSIAFGVYYLVPIAFTNWFSLGIGYLFMLVVTAISILFITRLLPHGKEHEELLKKLYAHTKNKLQLRFIK
jgi:O-antigen/teichoic acid export membrane protein